MKNEKLTRRAVGKIIGVVIAWYEEELPFFVFFHVVDDHLYHLVEFSFIFLFYQTFYVDQFSKMLIQILAYRLNLQFF